MGPIATEITKIALSRLASVSPGDVAKVARTLRTVGVGAGAAAASATLGPTLLAFGVGAAVGVGVALLVAPESGAATRAKLSGVVRRVLRRAPVTATVVSSA